jgi:hypothetical protein
MMVNIPNNLDQEMIQRAGRIELIAERISSPSRMEGRNVIQQMQWVIDAARAIIEAAEVIKIANLPKDL